MCVCVCVCGNDDDRDDVIRFLRRVLMLLLWEIFVSFFFAPVIVDLQRLFCFFFFFQDGHLSPFFFISKKKVWRSFQDVRVPKKISDLILQPVMKRVRTTANKWQHYGLEDVLDFKY